MATISTGAAVSGSLLIGFNKEVEQVQKEDVVNSLLLAQTAASAIHDPTAEPNEWFAMYSQTLQQVGWTMQAFTFLERNDANTFASADQVILDILTNEESLARGNLVTAIVTILALKSAGLESDAQSALDKSSISKSGNSVSFQLAVVENANGDIVLHLHAFIYSLPPGSNVENALWTSWGDEKNIKFSYASQTMTLNQSLYARVRDAVIEKLQGHLGNVVPLEV